MGILDDTAIFIAVIQQGGFSHAAKHLGLSNGLISRRIAQLESELGVTLIKRTTRQIQLTPKGELLWLHAERIKQELDSAISLIQSSAKKPTGTIRVSAPLYFGRHYLTPIIMKFMRDFNNIHVELILSNQKIDPVKSQLDLTLRGAGFLGKKSFEDSSMQIKLLLSEKIGLYASPLYLQKHGEPTLSKELSCHEIIQYSDNTRTSTDNKWTYLSDHDKCSVNVKPRFSVNDIESALFACVSGYGIGRLTELHTKTAIKQHELRPILTGYDWGTYNLYALYPEQQALPKRTRLFLDFLHAHTKNLLL